MTILTQFVTISQASVLGPIITGAFVYRKLPMGFRIFYYFLILCIGFEILASLLRVLYGNNMPGLHLFTLVEFGALSAVFHQHFRKHQVMRRMIIWNVFCALLIAVTDATLTGSIFQANTLSRTYDAAWIIIYTLLYFYRVFLKDNPQSLLQDPMFWFSVAALVYFGNNIVYFLVRVYMLSHARQIESFGFCVYLSLNIIAHLIYAYAFTCFRKWKTAS